MNHRQLVQDVMDGVESPFKGLKELRDLQKSVKKAIDIVQTEAFNQAEHEPKTFNSGAYEVTKKNGAKMWNFKNCSAFIDANDNLEKVKNDLKLAHSAWESGKSLADDDTGELMEVPVVTYKADSIQVKLAK